MKNNSNIKSKKIQIAIIIITSIILVFCIVGAGVAIYYAQHIDNITSTSEIIFLSINKFLIC